MLLLQLASSLSEQRLSTAQIQALTRIEEDEQQQQQQQNHQLKINQFKSHIFVCANKMPEKDKPIINW